MIRASLFRLRRDDSGSVLVEFGLLAPLMFALLLGVLQVGLGMHAYNALRGIASDVGRHAVVNYQADSELSNADLTEFSRATAILPPYGLSSDDVQVSVVNAGTQRVDGAKELTFTITYTVPSLLQFIDVDGIDISFERPIFVLDD